MTPSKSALRAAALAATAAPWRSERDGSNHRGKVWESGDGGCELIGVMYCGAFDSHGFFNAQYVAAASPDVVLALLDENEALAGELSRAKDSEEKAWTSRREYFSQRNDNMRAALERIAEGLPPHESAGIAAESLAEYHRMRQRPTATPEDVKL